MSKTIKTPEEWMDSQLFEDSCYESDIMTSELIRLYHEYAMEQKIKELEILLWDDEEYIPDVSNAIYRAIEIMKK